MQVKTTIKYHVTYFRRAIIIKTRDQKCYVIYKYKGTLVSLGGNIKIGIAIMRKCIEFSPKIKKGITI